MKKTRFALVALSCALLFVACEPFLIYENQLPEFKAPADKALCVIIRPSGFFNNTSMIYVDRKIVSGTTGNNITSFSVDPGKHLVLGKINNTTKVRFDFKAGKVYFILQTTYPVPFVGVLNTFVPMPGDEAMSKIESEKGKCRFSRYNEKSQESDLDKKDVDEELADWEKWAKENPDKAKVEIEYPGY
jgi:hypothetical protein